MLNFWFHSLWPPRMWEIKRTLFLNFKNPIDGTERRMLAFRLVTCNVASILWYLKLIFISMVAINHTNGCPQNNNLSFLNKTFIDLIFQSLQILYMKMIRIYFWLNKHNPGLMKTYQIKKIISEIDQYK